MILMIKIKVKGDSIHFRKVSNGEWIQEKINKHKGKCLERFVSLSVCAVVSQRLIYLKKMNIPKTNGQRKIHSPGLSTPPQPKDRCYKGLLYTRTQDMQHC